MDDEDAIVDNGAERQPPVNLLNQLDYSLRVMLFGDAKKKSHKSIKMLAAPSFMRRSAGPTLYF